MDDPTKPDIPYTKGAIFIVQSHVAPPPTPFRSGYYCIADSQEREELQKLTPVERCLQYPPLPGPEDGSSFSVILDFVAPIQVGDLFNAQLFTVNARTVPHGLETWPASTTIVAKVYDPLYHDDDDGDLNSFCCMDQDYTHEVQAYKVLSEFQGGLIPRFYGSYSLKLACPGFEKLKQRTVRLILMEYISGKAMHQVDPAGVSQKARQRIMKTLVDFESSVYHKDIAHDDLIPRNVILHPSLLKRDIVFIDFAQAFFARRPQLFLGQYVSPLLRWKKSPDEFESWIDWDWESWIEAEFAHTAGTITNEMRAAYAQPSSGSPDNEDKNDS